MKQYACEHNKINVHIKKLKYITKQNNKRAQEWGKEY